VTKFLSPAALAAYNSFHGAEDGEYVDGVWVTYSNRMIAAALRVLADWTQYTDDYGTVYLDPEEVSAIALELDSYNG